MKDRLVYADADHYASGHTKTKRRDKDIAFLARVMELRAASDVRGLTTLLKDHVQAPEWKQVAIKRALKAAVMAAGGTAE